LLDSLLQEKEFYVYEMSDSVFKVPKEILVKIFSYMDLNSLYKAGLVCHKWSDAVQMIHDKEWKAVTRAVMLKKEIAGPRYKSRGWIEEYHCWNECKCLDMTKDLIFYDSFEMLDRDLKVFKTTILESIPEWPGMDEIEADAKLAYSRFEIDGILPPLPCEELTLQDIGISNSVARLAAAGILTTIEDSLTLRNVNLLHVQNVSHLIRISSQRIHLREISCDLSTIFNHINCKELELSSRDPLTDEEVKSLTKLLDEGLEYFNYGYSPTHKCLPSIQHYDGTGKCHEIEFEYDCWGDNEFEMHLRQELDEVKIWASGRGWSVEVDEHYCEVVTLKRI